MTEVPEKEKAGGGGGHGGHGPCMGGMDSKSYQQQLKERHAGLGQPSPRFSSQRLLFYS